MTVDVVCLRPEADFIRAGVAPPGDLAIAYRKPDDADLPALLRQARALLMPAVGPRLPAALFEGAPLRLVQVTGAGVDRLDEAALRRLGIAVANVPGGSNGALAEYATACALVLLRRLAWADAEIKRGRYAACRSRMLGDNLGGLGGATVGVVGLGTIGLAVARAFRAFGSRIVYHDPAPRDPQAAAALEARPLPLPQLLACADVVTLHVPLLPQTANLIGAAELALMKPDAVLIHAARGGVVDETALAAALAAGRIAGAAIDVYGTEPAAADNPLLQLAGEAAARLLLTPHIAGVTRQASAYLFRCALDNVVRVLVRGEPPLNRVY
jgi:phosphoglycerate dehydrogenase-like enzyme